MRKIDFFERSTIINVQYIIAIIDEIHFSSSSTLYVNNWVLSQYLVSICVEVFITFDICRATFCVDTKEKRTFSTILMVDQTNQINICKACSFLTFITVSQMQLVRMLAVSLEDAIINSVIFGQNLLKIQNNCPSTFWLSY